MYPQKSVLFTTSTANYELLTDLNVKNSIKSRLGWDDDTYDYAISPNGNGINGIYFSIQMQGAGSKISVNNETYNTTPDLMFYETLVKVTGLKSIRVETTAITGVVSYVIF